MAKGTRRESLPITKERLEELFEFNRDTGWFIWKSDRRGGAKKGQRAGSVDRTKQGYRWIRVDQVDYLAQRLAWFWEYGEWPDIVKFRNGDRTDCSIKNLRDAQYVEQGKHNWRTKEGKSAQQKEYRATIVDQLRDKRLRDEFGIDLATYNRMHSEQGGVCAICGNPETAKRNGKTRMLAVDHCHDSQKVRGLLCGNCNPMIGYARDNIKVLEKAIEYLNSHKGAE